MSKIMCHQSSVTKIWLARYHADEFGVFLSHVLKLNVLTLSFPLVLLLTQDLWLDSVILVTQVSWKENLIELHF